VIPNDYMTTVTTAAADGLAAFAPLVALVIGAGVAIWLAKLGLSLLSGRGGDSGGGKRVASASMPRKGVIR